MATATLNYVDAGKISVTRLPGAVHLRVEIADDKCVLAAQFKRIFPLSYPDRYISIQTPDEKEVAILETVEGMDEGQRQLILEELDRRYFTPTISRIDLLKQDAGMWRFAVQTQRGPAEFFVRNWRDSSHEVSPGRWQIVSVDGLRFEIPRVGELDARSQDMLDQLF